MKFIEVERPWSSESCEKPKSFTCRLLILESESRRRLIYLQQNNSVGEQLMQTNNVKNFGSQSLNKKIEIGNISGVVVASSAMGFTIFDLFNEIINIDDMNLGCSHWLTPIYGIQAVYIIAEYSLSVLIECDYLGNLL